MFGFILNHSNTHKSVLAENDRLRARVAELEASLAAHAAPSPPPSIAKVPTPPRGNNEMLSKPWLDIVLTDVLVKLRYGVFAVHGTAVRGDIAEFGTMTGTTATELAKAMQVSDKYQQGNYRAHGNRPKELHLFDSFEGLPDMGQGTPDGQSPHVAAGIWGKGTCKGLTPAQLHERVSLHVPGVRVKVFEGWFCDTLPTLPKGTTYAMIHIDCDLYSSAWDVLQFVFSNQMVSVGCHIYFDDWDCNRASEAYGERKAWKQCVNEFSVKYTDLGSYGFVSHGFIVHSYTVGDTVVEDCRYG